MVNIQLKIINPLEEYNNNILSESINKSTWKRLLGITDKTETQLVICDESIKPIICVSSQNLDVENSCKIFKDVEDNIEDPPQNNVFNVIGRIAIGCLVVGTCIIVLGPHVLMGLKLVKITKTSSSWF